MKLRNTNGVVFKAEDAPRVVQWLKMNQGRDFRAEWHLCHEPGLSHQGVNSTSQSNFTLRIVQGAPLITTLVRFSTLYFTVVNPVFLSLWNDFYKKNLQVNSQCKVIYKLRETKCSPINSPINNSPFSGHKILHSLSFSSQGHVHA